MNTTFTKVMSGAIAFSFGALFVVVLVLSDQELRSCGAGIVNAIKNLLGA